MYLLLKHFYLPLSEFIIFYFLQRPFLFCILFIASYIFVRFIFHSYNFQHPPSYFLLSNFPISVFLCSFISSLHICIYLPSLPFPVHHNSHYSFSTLHIKYANFISYATTLHRQPFSSSISEPPRNHV